MEIKYLKKLENYKGNNLFERKGLSLNEIQELEINSLNGNTFPTAVREFMFLAGSHNALALDIGSGYEWMQEKAKEVLEDAGEKIERPFFVDHQLDNCEYFSFFYLDENEEDPLVFICSPYYKEDDEEFITPIPQKKFSALIDAYVEKAIIDERDGGYS